MSGFAAVNRAVNPIGDRSRSRRLGKVALWTVATAVVVVVLQLAGVDVGGWLSGIWDTLTAVPAEYVIGALALQTLQTALVALAWLFILRAAHPHAHVPYAPVLAAYAVGTALNGVLPASIGTLVTLFMFVAIIEGATLSGVLAAAVVEKIFFSAMGVLVYLYLFASVQGSFTLELGGLKSHPYLVVLIAIGVVALVATLVRVFWPKLQKQWQQAKKGAAILSSWRAYALRVALPSLLGYCAKLGSIAIFLAAFSIPVTLGSVLHVVGGSSVASTTAITPGGAGVNEAVNVVALSGYTDSKTATAFTIAQHLDGTAWNVVVALVLTWAVFGLTSGEAMLKTAYEQARHRTKPA
jgi:uncharacterized membrane protein YbhN (UPF0104 family)